MFYIFFSLVVLHSAFFDSYKLAEQLMIRKIQLQVLKFEGGGCSHHSKNDHLTTGHRLHYNPLGRKNKPRKNYRVVYDDQSHKQ